MVQNLYHIIMSGLMSEIFFISTLIIKPKTKKNQK